MSNRADSKRGQISKCTQVYVEYSAPFSKLRRFIIYRAWIIYDRKFKHASYD